MIDLHTHILPGFDDGVRSVEEARELALHAAAEGVVAIAATPHVRDDYPTSAERMELGVERLRRDFADEGIEVELLHGGELSIERLWELPSEELVRFTLAQTGRYLLVEFPYRGWPPVLDQTIASLRREGITPVLAHPERNPEVQARPERLADAIAAGALLQVTAASIDGRLGSAPQEAARRLLELRLVHVLASDAHGRHVREPGLGAAAAAIGNPGLARYLTVEAPVAIAAGGPIPRV